MFVVCAWLLLVSGQRETNLSKVGIKGSNRNSEGTYFLFFSVSILLFHSREWRSKVWHIISYGRVGAPVDLQLALGNAVKCYALSRCFG